MSPASEETFIRAANSRIDTQDVKLTASTSQEPVLTVSNGEVRLSDTDNSITVTIANTIDTAIDVVLTYSNAYATCTPESLRLDKFASRVIDVTAGIDDIIRLDSTKTTVTCTPSIGTGTSFDVILRATKQPASRVKAVDISGKPGDTVQLLWSSLPTAPDAVDALQFTLQWNSSVLRHLADPTGYTVLRDSVLHGTRSMVVEVQLPDNRLPGYQVQLPAVKFKVGLGNAVSSLLFADNFAWLRNGSSMPFAAVEGDTIQVRVLDNRIINARPGTLVLSVTPNPVATTCSVHVTGALGDGELTLFNSLGFVVARQATTKHETTYDVDLTSLPIGSYILQFSDGNNGIVRILQKM
jgi:hypothetical protein